MRYLQNTITGEVVIFEAFFRREKILVVSRAKSIETYLSPTEFDVIRSEQIRFPEDWYGVGGEPVTEGRTKWDEMEDTMYDLLKKHPKFSSDEWVAQIINI